MKTQILAIGFLLLAIGFFQCQSPQESVNEELNLWPPIDPYETGYLKVSDIHEIYYEVCGNPEGKPVFVLHGGPGGSCRPIMRQFFDPEKFLIVLHDQRGAGRSKPYAEIKENTTWELVEDIERLREHLGIDSMMLVGGSWGSTLALAYAETYPEKVTDMVLRGVFTATQDEIDHFYHGGVKTIFPDVYDNFTDALPEPVEDSLPAYLFSLLTSEDSSLREEISRVWTKYEWKISDLDIKDNIIDEFLAEHSAYAFALIENYYMMNHCFLEEGQLWKNIDRIKGIPCTIVNGRFDWPCPTITAYKLHKTLPESRLIIAEMGGHGGDIIIEAVVEAVKYHE